MTREEAAIDYCLFIGNTSLDEVDAFKAGAEWEHKRLVERACKWLLTNKDNYIIDIEGETIVSEEIINDFKQTMEE